MGPGFESLKAHQKEALSAWEQAVKARSGANGLKARGAEDGARNRRGLNGVAKGAKRDTARWSSG